MPETIPRDVNLDSYLSMRPQKIIAITGFRRVGKTYLLLHVIKKLLAEMEREQVIYINFDDERIPERTEFLTALLPAVKRSVSGDIEYLFLDEIQDMPQWSRWLRRIYDTESMRIFITGSSSKVSSRELPTELRGRALEIRVFPLSFREFLRFMGAEIDFETVEYSENGMAQLSKLLDEYIYYGGMPEVVLSSEAKKFEILHQYYATVVSRDIIERHNVKNEEGLKAMLRLLLNSTQYSISKLYNTLKSSNYGMGKSTIQHYLSYVEDSYFIRSIPVFSHGIKDQMQYPRKVYFIDSGFITALSTKFSKNMGRLYENMVAVELMRRNAGIAQDIYYWKGDRGKEVDFVIMDGRKIKQLIQVSYDMDDQDTRKREFSALIKASEELKCRNLFVITEREEGVEDVNGRKIKVVPMWKFLLHPENSVPDQSSFG